MIKDSSIIQAKDFKVGLYTRSDIINPNPDISPNCMDIQWFFDNTIGKRLGHTTVNTVMLSSGGGTAGFIVGGALTNNLTAYWKLDEGAGDRTDSVGTSVLKDNNLTGSIIGIRNNAAYFISANSNSLILPNTSTVQTGNTPFAIAGWFYLNSTSATVESTIVSKRDPGPDLATVLLLHCDGANGGTTFTDSAPVPKTVTVAGNAQTSTTQVKFGTASCLLDGSGDYLELASSTDFDLDSSGAYSGECWIYLPSLADDYYIMGNADVSGGVGGGWAIWIEAATSSIKMNFGATPQITAVHGLVINTWTHVAWDRGTDGVIRVYVAGAVIGTSSSNTSAVTGTNVFRVGEDPVHNNRAFNGFQDEVRLSKGIQRWGAAFTPPTAPYSIAAYEYSIYVNTDNLLTFSVSSSNLAANTSMTATSFGAIAVNTWYNFVAWGQTAGGGTGAHIGLSVNLSANTANYASGLKIGSAPFVVGALSNGIAGRPTAFLDGRVDELGFWKRNMNGPDRANIYAGGSGNTYTNASDPFSWYSFDFGATGVRWYTVCVGSGIVASSNLGTTFVAIATNRTATYQYLDRSKNVLIATSDAYDQTLYWAGSAGTFAIALALNSAPQAKFSVNYQGFLVLLNSMDSNGVISTRRFSYADENLQLTDPWNNSFDLPSSSDDEITGPFILNKFLYISTKYKIFRLNYTGGNPDWQYIQVKNFGYVPRTVKVFTLKQGQVAVGLDWSRRLRAFDGYDDQIISDNVENDNDYCDFAMQKISLAGSGLLVANAEFDPNQQEYRLNLAIGAQSTQTTHALVLNARTLAIYPYSNQQFNTICVAESAGKQFLMAADRSGFIHLLNSGNRDVAVPINEIYDSPLLFNKAPSEVTKNRQISFFFGHDSCGTIYYQERFDFSRTFSAMRPLRNHLGNSELLGTESSLILTRTVDLPSVQNIYQYRLTSSAGTADPWKLIHFDLLNSSLGYGRGK